MSMGPVTTKSHAEATCHLVPGKCTRTMLPQGPCQFEWPTLTPGAHGDIQVQVGFEDSVWVYGSTTARVCVDVQWPMVPPKSKWMPRV